ncbi:hypothetical protein ACS0TY_020496 [Phlomoides rotata]
MFWPDSSTGKSLLMFSVLLLLLIDSYVLLTCCMLMTFSYSARPVEGMLDASNLFLILMQIFLGRYLILTNRRLILESMFLCRIELTSVPSFILVRHLCLSSILGSLYSGVPPRLPT